MSRHQGLSRIDQGLSKDLSADIKAYQGDLRTRLALTRGPFPATAIASAQK